MNIAVTLNIENKEFWETLKESLAVNTEYENGKDVISILTLVNENPNFDLGFWQKMSEKATALKE